MNAPTTRAARIAELNEKLRHFHERADKASERDERDVYAGIANGVAREIVMLLAAIHSPKKGA